MCQYLSKLNALFIFWGGGGGGGVGVDTCTNIVSYIFLLLRFFVASIQSVSVPSLQSTS